jgi:ATP-binding dynein motor region
LVPIFQETAGKIKHYFFYSFAIFVLQPLIPTTDDLDPLLLLTDDAQIAAWNNEGLPSDRMSTENATILTNSQRWPLMIDPQVISS